VSVHERDGEDARPEDKRVLGLAQIKAAHTIDQRVADGEVEEACEARVALPLSFVVRQQQQSN
jgi:hypothetical protein